MKRSRFIIIFLIVLALVVVAGLLYRSRTTPSPPASAPAGTTLPLGRLPQATLPTGGQNQPGASPGIAAAQLGLVADIPVLDYFVDTNNNVFVVAPDGQIAEISNGQTTTISSSTFPRLASASFSYDGRFVLKTRSDGGQLISSVYDLNGPKETLIPIFMNSPAWAPDSDRLAFLADQGGMRALMSLNLADKNLKAKFVMELNLQDVVLHWVRPDTLLVVQKSSAVVRGSAWLLSLSAKTLQPVVDGQNAADALFDPAHPYGLIFQGTSRGRGGQLLLYAESGGETSPFPFVTLLSKCTFSVPLYFFNTTSTPSAKKPTPPPAAATTTASSTPAAAPSLTSPLYCFVPRDSSQLQKSPLPDLYFQRGFYTADDAFRVDAATGGTTMLYHAPFPLDATDAKVAGNRLFFVNRLDGRLYALTL